MKNAIKRLCNATGIPTYLLRNLLFEVKTMSVRLYGYTPMFRKRLAKVNASALPSVVFGCGDTKYVGWVHIDCSFGGHVDLVMDLRRKLPFADQSISYCYSEHFLEHLFPVEAARHLADVCRVLKSGGSYRIVVPDTGKFLRKYAEGDSNFFLEAHPWEAFPMDAIYSIVNWGGEHRSIYDHESLERVGRKAGFDQVILSSANGSHVGHLNIDRTDEHRIAESIYVEMVKAG